MVLVARSHRQESKGAAAHVKGTSAFIGMCVRILFQNE